MFLFDKEQKVLDIAGMKIGGQPGQHATVLCGTIFYAKHYLVEDPDKGIFDKKAAEDVLKKQEEFSDLTGNPCVMQIFSESPEAMEKEIAFCTGVSDVPFLIDSTVAETKTAGLKYADEVGLTGKAIYNSINISCTEEELAAIKNSSVEASIVLAFNPKDSSVAGKIDLLETGAGTVEKGLVSLARDMGITKPLIDAATLPIGAGAGMSIAAGFAVKSKFGLPVGLGIHNAPSAWTWLKEFRKAHATKGPSGWEGLGQDVFKICDIASNVLPIVAGHDFVLYGPIENATRAFPLVGMTDMIISEAAKAEHEIEAVEPHPILQMTA
ncbi:MAG TPA: tetrahydromethanopterin S-methyltransferase subunit H [Desulfobacteria bacterium]|nr:tetrahydromethanopterin S-methyltransferase subunit H [Desulfobacteria bacterium]